MASLAPLHLTDATLTGRAGANVAAGTFLKITGPAGIARPNGDPPEVQAATAATDAVIGVAAHDALDGEVVTIFVIGSTPQVVASAGITAGTFVTVTTDGKAVTVSGRATAIGVALTTVSNADDLVFVRLI